jgi:hypothetical protein
MRLGELRQGAQRLVERVDAAKAASDGADARARRAMRRASVAASTHMRASTAGPEGVSWATSSTSGRRSGATMPSVMEKPSAKSTRSAGVAIITACVPPL